MSCKRSVSKCTQVDTELVSMTASSGGGGSSTPYNIRERSPARHVGQIVSRPIRPARKLRRTFSDGQAANTSEEYLLNNCTLDSSFHDPSYQYAQRFSSEQLASGVYGNPYPHQPELICNCVHPNYYYASNSLPREKRQNAFRYSDQNISSRSFGNRSSEELLSNQRSLERTGKSRCKSHLGKGKLSNRPIEKPNPRLAKFDLHFLPVNKERSLDGEDYPFRSGHQREPPCSPSRCTHTFSSIPSPRIHAPQCEKYLGFSSNFNYDSQHFANSCNDFGAYDYGKSYARSLPPHFGDEPRRVEDDVLTRPRKSYGLGGRRVIVPDGCERDDPFETMYNVSGCQCERCDNAGYPGGYCHHQVPI